MFSFKGVVYVSATGDEIERFFNLCRNRDVTIRHITTSDTECTFEMDAADYLTLKPLLQKTHTKTVLLRKSGLPFLLYRQKKRLVFWVVLLLFVVMLSMTLTRIWKIEIYGNQTISFVQFLDFLKEEKIGYGSAKGKIDDKALQATIRERFPQVIWASVSIEGTCLVIHVKENDTLFLLRLLRFFFNFFRFLCSCFLCISRRIFNSLFFKCFTCRFFNNFCTNSTVTKFVIIFNKIGRAHV